MNFQQKRKDLVNELREKGIINNDVLNALLEIPRHKFVPKKHQKEAYKDYPLPIGENQTISQPYTVAFMLEALEVGPGQKVLDIGTGSGYNAALLSKLVKEKGQVITLEIKEELIKKAKQNLKSYKNIKIIKGDGSQGYSKEAPYDRIISTAAAPNILKNWLKQLKKEGIIIAPVGSLTQVMTKVTKKKNQLKKEDLGFFQFVPLKGEYGF